MRSTARRRLPRRLAALSALLSISSRAALAYSILPHEDRVTVDFVDALDSVAAAGFECVPTGECAPCPASAIDSPVCILYGKRRPVLCYLNATAETALAGSGDEVEGDDRALLLDDDQVDELMKSANGAEALDSQDNNKGGSGDADGRGAAAAHQQAAAAAAAAGRERGGPHRDADENAGQRALAAGEASENKGAVLLDPEPEALDAGDAVDAYLHDGRRDAARDAARAERRRRDESRRRRQLDAIESARSKDGRREIRTWESCARVPRQERADFFEFVLCNATFLAVAFGVLVLRRRKLAWRQYGKLVARIGIPIDTPMLRPSEILRAAPLGGGTTTDSTTGGGGSSGEHSPARS